jgi:hypothetical protein
MCLVRYDWIATPAITPSGAALTIALMSTA